jgi:hypothetical protein
VGGAAYSARERTRAHSSSRSPFLSLSHLPPTHTTTTTPLFFLPPCRPCLQHASAFIPTFSFISALSSTVASGGAGSAPLPPQAPAPSGPATLRGCLLLACAVSQSCDGVNQHAAGDGNGENAQYGARNSLSDICRRTCSPAGTKRFYPGHSLRATPYIFLQEGTLTQQRRVWMVVHGDFVLDWTG